MPFTLHGIPVSRGIAIGRAHMLARAALDVSHYLVDEDKLDTEVERLRAARATVRAELVTLKRELPADAPEELSAFLAVHAMFVDDPHLSLAAEKLIRERRYNAEWALTTQLEELIRQFGEIEDAYLRERKADIEQVVERLLRQMAAAARGSAEPAPTLVNPRDIAGADPLVLVAGDVAPADMLHFKRSVFTGFVTDVGGRTSHTAIVARSMDIPAVVGAREASRLIRQDDWVVIDGDAGVVIVDPSPIVLEEYRFRQRQSELERARLDRLRHTPAVTLDGQAVELLANIELPGDAAAALDAGAGGVGLFRSEFLFLNRGGDLPGEDEQYEAYRDAVLAMRGLPVTIRTVDIGADKPLERMSAQELRHEHGLNPALGLRAIRWSLAEPGMFRQQLRAILRASAHGKVRILIPMVAHLDEVWQVMELMARVRAQLDDAGEPYSPVELGAMIEVPAAALLIDRFLRHFDFVSIGTNDLIQYTLAIDRVNERVSYLYEPLHPAVLKLIRQMVDAGHKAGIEVAMCGEMAGEPVYTMVLLGLGLDELSMNALVIPRIKKVIRAVTVKECRKLVDRIMSFNMASEIEFFVRETMRRKFTDDFEVTE
jgi:phosphotransferase system enzyme I (PtsI)